MNQKTFCIVTTTINVPHLLREYALDAKKHQHKIERFIVVADKKTPVSAEEYCRVLQHDTGTPVEYLSVEAQQKMLRQLPDLDQLIPWNCIQRRNIGMLSAYDGNADIVITIDDDNFLRDTNYLAGHAHVGETRAFTTATTTGGWWNPGVLLNEARGLPFYHRGHPFSQRWQDAAERVNFTKGEARCVVNAGLWLGDPDVDAIARLFAPIESTGLTERGSREPIACAPRVWAPFNSQNTALLREVIPAYFLFPRIGRYDDIWASFVLRRIADERGDVVTYGRPLVHQKRNPHDYLKDFDDQRLGMEWSDIFIEGLKRCRLSATTYPECFAEISAQLAGILGDLCKAQRKDSAIFSAVLRGFEVWVATFHRRPSQLRKAS